MGNDNVSCEVTTYTVYVANRSAEGRLLDTYRGFNHDINAEFCEEENYVLFTVRNNVRKAVIKFEHTYATWNNLRMQACQGNLGTNLITSRELKAAYNISDDLESNKRNFSLKLDEMIKIIETNENGIEEYFTEIADFIKLSCLATPKLLVLTEQSHQMVAMILKKSLLSAIASISRAQEPDFSNLTKVSDIITNFLEPQLESGIWNRITTINMGMSSL